MKPTFCAVCFVDGSNCPPLTKVITLKTFSALITRTIFWPAHQLQLLMKLGIRSRGRAIVKKLLQTGFGHIHRHPVLAQKILLALRMTGLEPLTRRIYARLRARNQKAQTGTYKSTIHPDQTVRVRQLADRLQRACEKRKP